MTSTNENSKLLHGTAIAIGDDAVLFRGASGSGKSDLALRCLNTKLATGQTSNASSQTPTLIADDYVLISSQKGHVIVSAPETIRGQLEVRGLGLVRVPTVPSAELKLIVELCKPEDVPRLPSPWPTTNMLSIDIPTLRLAPFETSTPLKIIMALLEPVENSLRA